MFLRGTRRCASSHSLVIKWRHNAMGVAPKHRVPSRLLISVCSS